MIQTIIVDDEPVITEELEDMVKGYKSYEIVGVFTEPLSALVKARSIKVDCAFLDIEMMGMSGIELAERLLTLNQDMEIIFVTAYNHYAAQAFELNAIDYLLKPVTPERLQKSMERIDKKREVSLKKSAHSCRINCFGSFEVFVDDTMIKWSRSKTRELFAYMIQWQGKSLSKYTLSERFWPEQPQEQALAYLQTSIWTIRKKFKEMGYQGIRIQYSDHRYLIVMEGIVCDVQEFEKHYHEYRSTGDLEELKSAVNCYQGEYLEGEDWLWAYPDRAKYERMYLELTDCSR